MRWILPLALAVACKSQTHTEPPAPVCAGPERHGALPWFADDYEAAKACAVKRQQSLVIDMWAPWCHTCLSMKHTVLDDDTLARYAARFVFLALDTDREVNAPIVAQFPPAAWPTFFVVDPNDESIRARFVGAATLAQWTAFLESGEPKATVPWQVAAREGDTLAASERHSEAAVAYAQALALAPAGATRRSDLIVSLAAAHADASEWAACARSVISHASSVAPSASLTDLFVHGQQCAAALATSDAALASEVRRLGQTKLTDLLANPAAQLSVDDRSDAMANLRSLLVAAGQQDQAMKLAAEQRTLLDQAAANATTAAERMTYNWPRAEVYVALGVPLELAADLEANAAALPKEYDPPYRLAWIYSKGDKPDLARTWAHKAAELAYGPRKVRVLEFLAQLTRDHWPADEVAAWRAVLSAAHAPAKSVAAIAKRAERRLAELAEVAAPATR